MADPAHHWTVEGVWPGPGTLTFTSMHVFLPATEMAPGDTLCVDVPPDPWGDPWVIRSDMLDAGMTDVVISCVRVGVQ